MKKIAKYTTWIGLILVIGGFVYDVAFAGIPYQDPPPELQLKYERDSQIASWLMQAGLVVLVIGLVLTVVARITQKKAAL